MRRVFKATKQLLSKLFSFILKNGDFNLHHFKRFVNPHFKLKHLPEKRGVFDFLTLGPLRGAASLFEAELLAFFGARIAGQIT